MTLPSPSVEVARLVDASEVRALTRRLLAGGITASVVRTADEQVVLVPAADAEAAAAMLDLDPADLRPVAPEEAAGSDEVAAPVRLEDLPPPPEPEPEPAGLEIDERGMVVVALVESEDEARAMAGSLLERGIGAEIASAFETGFANSMIDPAGSTIVRVLDVDTDRTLELLGTEPPRRMHPPAPEADEPVAGGDEPDGGDAPSPASPSKPPRRHRKAEPEEVREYLGGRLRLTKRQLVVGIVVYVVALILIPIVFYLGTRWIFEPDIEEPVTTLPTGVVVPAVWGDR